MMGGWTLEDLYALDQDAYELLVDLLIAEVKAREH
jgi:hypothetical protein